MTQEGIEISTGHGFMNQNYIYKISNGQILIYRDIILLRVLSYLNFTPVLYNITETSRYILCLYFPSYSHTHKCRSLQDLKDYLNTERT